MNRLKIFTITFAVVLTSSINAQVEKHDRWSLKDCIDYAVEHNLTLKKSANTIELNRLEKETTKWSRLPDLNGSASSSVTWARDASQSPTKHTRSNANTFSLTSSVPLFTGLEQPNRLKQAKLNLSASIEDLEKAKNDLSINITSLYIQVIFTDELIAVAENQLSLSQEQLNRGITLSELGKLPKADLYELKARLKQDEVSLVEAKNNYQIALLDLAQLLEFETPINFKIAPLEGELEFDKLTAPDQVYEGAIHYMPEVLAEEYRVQSTERAIKIARAGFLPKLNFNAGLGSSYNTIRDGDYDTFGRQMRNNFNQYIGVTLSIPIFNRFSNQNSLKSAKINKLNQIITLSLTKKTLYNEIQKAWYNANASESKYNASLEARIANQESFRVTKEKYELGKATNLEFNESKVNLLRADYDLIKAKYDYLFRIKLLNFYKGHPIQ